MRLIDADALRDLMDGGYDIDFSETPELKRELLNMVDYQETVDAAPVVRCGECKHAIQRSEEQIANGCSPLFCDNFIFGAYPEFFCMDGERKGGDE